MRKPEYMSFTSLSKFEADRADYYLQYLCDHKRPRSSQMDFMAVGSTVDAYAKSAIHEAIFGVEETKGTQFQFENLFEEQVQSHVRDLGLHIGTDVWCQYCECGAFASLLEDIEKSPRAPRMEFRVKRDVQGVTLLGYPDLCYETAEGTHVYCDWKVCGSTSKVGASPTAGYQIARDCRESNTHGKSHKRYKPMTMNGMEINSGYLEEYKDYWAAQISGYAWMLEQEVGNENWVARFEELTMRRVKTRDLPRGKFSTHMSRVSKEFQLDLHKRFLHAWNVIESGHIFDWMPREESDMKCKLLDRQASVPAGLFPQLQSSSKTKYFR